MINDYSSAKQTVLDEMKPYMISYTQKEAGFESTINEKVLVVEAPKSIYDILSEEYIFQVQVFFQALITLIFFLLR